MKYQVVMEILHSQLVLMVIAQLMLALSGPPE